MLACDEATVPRALAPINSPPAPPLHHHPGAKADFDSHSKQSMDNLHIYASVYGDRCYDMGAQLLPTPGYAEVYANNTCVLLPGSECMNLAQKPANIPAPAIFHTRFAWYNNTVYSTDGSGCRVGGGPVTNMSDFQSEGYEAGAPSTFNTTLPLAWEIIAWAQAKLGGAPARIAAAVSAA